MKIHLRYTPLEDGDEEHFASDLGLAELTQRVRTFVSDNMEVRQPHYELTISIEREPEDYAAAESGLW